MCNLDPVTGEIYCVSNTFFERFSRMMYNWDTGKYNNLYGIAKLVLPFLMLVGLFFVLKRYTKNKKILIMYPFVAIILYILIVWLFTLRYVVE